MNLNIFKRIADLEAAQKQADAQIDLLKTIVYKQSNWLKTMEEIQSLPRKPSTEKAKAYARAYYAKKKAEREGRKYVNVVKVAT